MENIDFGKELSRAALAAGVAFIAALILKALGAGKWLVAAGSGTVGGLTAVPIVA